MTPATKERGGSFRELRARHLPMFDDRVRRHDRGWPHPTPDPGGRGDPKRRWRTVGIVHYRDEIDETSAAHERYDEAAGDAMIDFAAERERMIDRTIARRGLGDPALIAAFRAVPREEFISGDYAEHAYADAPLPIESGQTISQPYIVALTIDAAGIGPDDKVLEIGAGSGYAAAVIGQVAREVIAIERHHELVKLAQDRMRRLGYGNVHIIEGDGTRGCPAEAPFDAIVAAASGSHVPSVLVDQLKPGGRIVMPIGDPHSVQSLVKLTKRTDGLTEREDLGAVRFVPLIGEHGFGEDA